MDAKKRHEITDRAIISKIRVSAPFLIALKIKYISTSTAHAANTKVYSFVLYTATL